MGIEKLSRFKHQKWNQPNYYSNLELHEQSDHSDGQLKKKKNHKTLKFPIWALYPVLMRICVCACGYMCVCGVPSYHQTILQIPAECPKIQISSDIIYLVIMSDITD